MMSTAICCLMLGFLAGWLVVRFKDLSAARRKTDRRLQELAARLQAARRLLAVQNDSIGPVVGLASWMRNHAAKLLAKSSRQLETAGELRRSDPQGASQIVRDIELHLVALDILADFSQRYLEPMAVLQRQGADQLLREIGGLRERLQQRVDRHSRSADLLEESRRLDLLSRYVDKELGDNGPTDPAALFRRLTTQLRTLNEIECRLNFKVDGIRSSVT